MGSSLYDTLRARIQTGIHLGTLRPGQRLPSVRELEAELHAGQRVILAAYRQLAAEGLISIRPRSGVFVRSEARSAGEPLPEVASWIVELFLRGLARDIPPTRLRPLLLQCLRTFRSLSVACVECNHDQIQALCHQVREDYGLEAAGVDLDRLPRDEALRRKASQADLVLTTRFHADDAQRLGQRLGRPVLVATLDTTFANEIRRMLARGPVWWVCTDPRFAEKLPRMWPGAPVRPLVLRRDPLDAIPGDAAVYATRAAAARLPRGWREGRVVTMRRVLSAATAEALMAFRVRRTLESIS